MQLDKPTVTRVLLQVVEPEAAVPKLPCMYVDNVNLFYFVSVLSPAFSIARSQAFRCTDLGPING